MEGGLENDVVRNIFDSSAGRSIDVSIPDPCSVGNPVTITFARIVPTARALLIDVAEKGISVDWNAGSLSQYSASRLSLSTQMQDAASILLPDYLSEILSDSSNTDSHVVRNVLLTLLFAGRENYLGWSLHAMLAEPDWMDQLREETAANGGHLTAPAFEEMSRYHKHLTTFYETVQLWPGFPKNARLALCDDMPPALPKLGLPAVKIDKGDYILWSDYHMMQDEETWRFTPGRHLDSKGHFVKPAPPHLNRFGTGPRLCPAAQLAAYELFVVLLCWVAYVLFVKPRFSSLRSLPGPRNPSFLYGNLFQIYHKGNTELHEDWVERYGSTIRSKGWFNEDRLYTMDTKALAHILNHPNIYQKPKMVQFLVAEVVEKGLLAVEGEHHRRQRRIANAAFGAAQIRDVTGIFIEKAIQLRDIWNEEISVLGERARLDVHIGLTKMTLDVIGLAGFDYDLSALKVDEPPNEFNQAFAAMIGPSTGKPSIYPILRYFVPPVRYLPTQRLGRVKKAKAAMRRIGMQLIQQKKAEIAAAMADGNYSKSSRSRDLLTVLLEANLTDDVPEHHRLTDDDVMAQIPTFLVAGHDTTNNSTAWALYALGKASAVQDRLRAELLEVPTETPTMDVLNALPYLDAVVRETLRLYAPVPATLRTAMEDDVIPLKVPFIDTSGQVQYSIRIKKGTPLDIPLLALNRSKVLWGQDAHQFNPERWESIPESAQSIPGAWSNLMTFMSGPHACVGYRFSIVEMKALLFTLIRAFVFELAVPADDITHRSTLVRRPVVRSEIKKGPQLPMIVTMYRAI
ncbi:uncharacterized protein FIBRA_05580 [Fibroporia radiculosa]|uniref:Cytochrome P450 n=1 Tax=Fibroporia radiculosa TaxID=599839 RepID=J4HXS4_9APHY|nr:uncharacterized protein FIBRA_05580 [Fibroporia radiculosa]CCM03447.1 predicted protein [Fibroporia radiculosa]